MRTRPKNNVVIYKRIPGWPKYLVGSNGRVISVHFGKRRLLRPSKHRDGHLQVVLQDCGTKKMFYVHQLVLLAFRGPCPVGMQIRHWPDKNPENNSLKNLSYGTYYDNRRDMRRHGSLKGELNPFSKLSEKLVVRIRNLYRSCGLSQCEIADMFDLDQTTVSGIVNYKSWAHVA